MRYRHLLTHLDDLLATPEWQASYHLDVMCLPMPDEATQRVADEISMVFDVIDGLDDDTIRAAEYLYDYNYKMACWRA